MKFKGSMTLEAAYIFPITIVIVFALIFFAYYEHDITIIKSEVRTLLIKTVEEGKKSGIKEEFENRKKAALFYLLYSVLSEENSGKRAKLSVGVNFKILPFVSEYLDSSLTDGSFEEIKEGYTPQTAVRRAVGILGESE